MIEERIPEFEGPTHRSWFAKFADAFRGAALGFREQKSFWVHLPMTAAVIAAAAVLQASLAEWCILLLCVASVMVAELFNSALESMARAITREQNPHVGGALDLGSAAVLFASISSAIVGGVVLGNRAGHFVGWW